MKLPVVRKRVVWHVGWLAGRAEPPSGYEGSGLAVSEVPEAWRRIAKLDGPVWECRRAGVFVDYRKLENSPVVIAELRQKAIRLGLLDPVPALHWEGCYYDEEVHDDEDNPDSGWICTPYNTYEEAWQALEDYRDDEGNWNQTQDKFDETWWFDEAKIEGPYPYYRTTPKAAQLWQASGMLGDPDEEKVFLMLIEQLGTYDGVWWRDPLNPHSGYGWAPRGVIFRSKLDRWNCQEARRWPRTGDE